MQILYDLAVNVTIIDPKDLQETPNVLGKDKTIYL
jgi:hypothetical protein